MARKCFSALACAHDGLAAHLGKHGHAKAGLAGGLRRPLARGLAQCTDCSGPGGAPRKVRGWPSIASAVTCWLKALGAPDAVMLCPACVAARCVRARSLRATTGPLGTISNTMYKWTLAPRRSGALRAGYRMSTAARRSAWRHHPSSVEHARAGGGGAGEPTGS